MFSVALEASYVTVNQISPLGNTMKLSEQPTAEVIAIGDELTSGQRLDTNSQWVSQRLGELGVVAAYHTTVADDLSANVSVFRQAIQRADIVVTTGGLGPTADDLTRDALAQALDVDLYLDEESLEYIRTLFARRGRTMPDQNAVQAKFPTGSRPIPNPHGTAPGIAISIDRENQSPCYFVCLPGVSAELREMWQASVSPAIRAAAPEVRIVRHHLIKCFGVGESQLESRLPDLIRRGRDPRVGITVSEATITLRITASGQSEEECHAKIEPTVATIRDCVGDLIFGEGDVELQHVVARTLAERNATLSLVEIGTGGLIAHWLQRVDPDGRQLLVALSGDTLDPLAKSVGCEMVGRGSEQGDALSRTTGALRRQVGADLGLAVAIMPVEGAEGDFCHMVLDLTDGGDMRRHPLVSHPAIRQPLAAKMGLDLLRKSLLSQRDRSS